MDSRAVNAILEKCDQLGQESRIKSLTILESNNDLFCLMVFDVSMKRFQVIIKVFPTLFRGVPSVQASSHSQKSEFHSHPFPQTARHHLPHARRTAA